jgi:mercuric ion transport protein
VLTCPCHLPILAVVLAGTTAGAFLGEHWVIAALGLTGLFPESVSPGARMLGLVCFVASCPFNLTAWEMTSPNSMALDRRNRELVGDLFGLACNCPTPQPRGQAIFMDP